MVGEDGSVIASLEGGHFFGEIGVLFEVPRTFSVIAYTACDLVVVHKDRLEQVRQSVDATIPSVPVWP